MKDKYVYLVSGSEDGTYAVYSSFKKANAEAKSYVVRCDDGMQAEDIQVRHYNGDMWDYFSEHAWAQSTVVRRVVE